MTHLAIHGFFGVSNYAQSLLYVDVVSRYRAPISALLLLVLLVAALFHGLYGLRALLLDVRRGRRWEQTVTYGTLALGVVVAAWGLRTIVFTAFGIGR